MSDCGTPETYDDGSSYVDPYATTDGAEYSDPWNVATTTMELDMDQDGLPETTVIDIDGDGVADAYDTIDWNTGAEQVVLDSNLDGLLDTVVSDLDGDGIFEAASQDTDADGVLDTTLDPETGLPVETGTEDPFAPFVDTTDVNDDVIVDPVDIDVTDDGVHGDPMAEIPYHQAQVSSNDCLPTSVAMIVSEATGTVVDQAEVVDLANELGLLGEMGMTMEGGLQLLEHYGVEAEVQTGSMDELRAMLDADTPVIIGLDSDDLYGEGDEPFADDFVAGHAVVITGIDDEAGLVYINDPGFPDGAGVAIPIEQFEDAWQDGDNMMIVAEGYETPEDVESWDSSDADTLTSAGSAGSASAETVEGADRGERGEGLLERAASLVLLPINLVVR